jgi:hypothetical protein
MMVLWNASKLLLLVATIAIQHQNSNRQPYNKTNCGARGEQKWAFYNFSKKD